MHKLHFWVHAQLLSIEFLHFSQAKDNPTSCRLHVFVARQVDHVDRKKEGGEGRGGGGQHGGHLRADPGAGRGGHPGARGGGLADEGQDKEVPLLLQVSFICLGSHAVRQFLSHSFRLC